MSTTSNIPFGQIEHDSEIAQYHVFEQFLVDYQPILVRVENYLDEVIVKTDSVYREAYVPWKKALHELLEGVYLMAKKIPLANKKEEFVDALFMFSFKSTIMFLRDICSICQLKLKRGWEKEFQEQINLLLVSITDSVQPKATASY